MHTRQELGCGDEDGIEREAEMARRVRCRYDRRKT